MAKPTRITYTSAGWLGEHNSIDRYWLPLTYAIFDLDQAHTMGLAAAVRTICLVVLFSSMRFR